MGNVYLAEDVRLQGRVCAIKEVHQDFSLSDELLKQARDQFEREATILARLDHPNLPKVSDFFAEGDSDYLVMDFIPGKDLRTWMIEYRQREEFIPEDDILRWADQLADALVYMHAQNPPILHRDIKPSNMKVTPNGLLKLVDFGLVKLMAPDEMTITILQGRGTALYTPLEQYGGDTGHTDVRSDIYAFGATLYHLLTLTPPQEARERFLNPVKLVPPQEINPNISPRVQRAVLWALALHPDERPQDVDTFRKVLLGEKSYASYIHTVPRPKARKTVFGTVERVLAAVASLLMLFSLLISLVR